VSYTISEDAAASRTPYVLASESRAKLSPLTCCASSRNPKNRRRAAAVLVLSAVGKVVEAWHQQQTDASSASISSRESGQTTLWTHYRRRVTCLLRLRDRSLSKSLLGRLWGCPQTRHRLVVTTNLRLWISVFCQRLPRRPTSASTSTHTRTLTHRRRLLSREDRLTERATASIRPSCWRPKISPPCSLETRVRNRRRARAWRRLAASHCAGIARAVGVGSRGRGMGYMYPGGAVPRVRAWVQERSIP
jgi:hypothetical protein